MNCVFLSRHPFTDVNHKAKPGKAELLNMCHNSVWKIYLNDLFDFTLFIERHITDRYRHF